MKIHYSKALGASFALALLGLSASAQTGIGTGNVAPRTMLDVNGAISVAEGTVAVTGTTAVLPSGFSLVKVTGTPSGAFTLTAPTTTPAPGQLLTIYNTTGFDATFSGQTITAGQALNLVFSSSAWQATANGGNTPTTASNGLTKTLSNITLGGTLTGATTIAQGNNAFSLTGGNVGIGTSAPGTSLYVLNSGTGGGAVTSGKTANMALRLENSTNGQAVIQHFLAKDASGNVKQALIGVNPIYNTNGVLYIGRAGSNDFAMDLVTGYAGIGVGTARTTLDVNGAIAVVETTSSTLTGANPAYVVPTNVSQVQLIANSTTPPTGTIAVTTTTPFTGQKLAIYNNTAIPATLNSQTIPAGLTLAFVYSAGGWQATAGGGNALTASNGLTRTGSNIALGGTLTTGPTFITLGGNNLQFVGAQGTGTTGASAIVAASGNVGVVNSYATALTLDVSSSVNDPILSFKPYDTGKLARIGTAGTNLGFLTQGPTQASDATSSTIAMLIANTGKVGIGTTTPRTSLDVSGAIAVAETASSALTGANPAYVVPTNVSQVQLVASTTVPTGTIAVTTTTPFTGQKLAIYNNTTIPATLNSQTIPAGLTVGFIYSNGNWQATASGSNALTASNGLTRTANNFTLGGALTQATTIPLGNNNLTFSTGTTGTGVLVLDGQGIAGSSTNTAKQRIEFTSASDPNAAIGHTVATGTAEISDLYLYSGNDNVATPGPDRIRLVAENILFQSFNNATNSTLANAEGNVSTVTNMLISATGIVGITTLAGTGSRTVVADASGNLSASTASPYFASGTTALFDVAGSSGNTQTNGVNSGVSWSTSGYGTAVVVTFGTAATSANYEVDFTLGGTPTTTVTPLFMTAKSTNGFTITILENSGVAQSVNIDYTVRLR